VILEVGRDAAHRRREGRHHRAQLVGGLAQARRVGAGGADRGELDGQAIAQHRADVAEDRRIVRVGDTGGPVECTTDNNAGGVSGGSCSVVD
jgi:hypothetical protein